MAQLTVMQRIENLERSNQDLDAKLNSSFDKIRGQVGYVMEVVDASTSAMKAGGLLKDGFESEVEAIILAKREVRKKERVDQENKQLASLVEMGVITPANTITANSLIVGRSFDDKGEVMGIGREQFELGNVHPSARDQFLGKEVGFMFENEGRKLEVLEIYEIQPQNEVKTTPVPSEEAVKVTAAQVAAATVGPLVS